MRDWFFLLSPWFALIGLIIWDTREKGEWRTKLNDPLTLFTAALAVATVALVWVAALQWDTLENTDHTIKETLQQDRDALVIQQRAFMTAKEIRFEPLTMFGIKGTTWLANVLWENSGNTPTKNLTIIANCVSGFEKLTDPAYIPKAKQATTFRTTTITKAVFGPDRKSTRLNSSHTVLSRMPSSA